jgi:polar amino acid transport system permease protein
VQPLNFGALGGDVDMLLWGAWLTVRLSLIAMALGMIVSVAGAYGRTEGPRPVQWAISAYVEVIRNTPFIIQIFLIFFGLPSAGLRLRADTAAIVAMVVNVGAYGTEIVRAGLDTTPRGQREAGGALGLKPSQVFRLIILPQAVRAVYPSLTSQFILLLLGSSVVSAISATELTAIASDIQARTFLSMEVYVVVLMMYFVISSAFSVLFAAIGRYLFRSPIAPGS